MVLASTKRHKVNLGRPALRVRRAVFLLAVLTAFSAAKPSLADDDPVNQNLRGLQKNIAGQASVGVFQQLDNSLLVTPGAHPAQKLAPLTMVMNQLPGKIDKQDLPRGKFQGWAISVSNNSERPVLFDGDLATATSSAGPVACVPMETLASLSILPEQSPSFKKRFVTDLKATTEAAVSVGWVQTIRDQKQGSGPIVAPNGGRYGLDEQRREDQLRRFGKRVLWPGDTTSGVIYFDGAARVNSRNISIDLPVASYYDKADQGVLKLTF